MGDLPCFEAAKVTSGYPEYGKVIFHDLME
jgi:hypothetical protein